MMDHNGFECEEVRIGNWRSRLPSEVCTNRQIFDEIFSLETWNKILNKEQQDKIMNMLPKELANDPEAARQTIEELLKGSLTLFSTNPLNNFFDQLEKGQYDPVVIDTKINIKREWKKESLRQLKSYHANLLEDIVVSRQKHLHRIKTLPLNSTSMQKGPKSKIYNSSSSVSSNQTSTTTALTLGAECPKKLVGNSMNKIDKPLVSNNSVSTVASRKRKTTNTKDLETNQGQPAAKKCLTTSTTTINADENQLVNNDQQIQSQNKFQTDRSLTSSLMPVVSTISDKSSSSSSSVSSSISNSTNQKSTITNLLSTTSSSISNMQTQKPNTVRPMFTSTVTKSNYECGSHTLINTGTRTTLSTTMEQCRSSLLEKKLNDYSQVLKSSFTSPTHSSPILASQLQASPQISVKVEDTLGLFQESESCRITLNYQSKSEDKSSDDDLETSSDEFEAIQPTIGFNSVTVASPTTVPEMLSSSSTSAAVNLSSPCIVSTSNSNVYQTSFISNKPIEIQQSYSSKDKSQPTLSQPVYLVNTKTFSPTLKNTICSTSSLVNAAVVGSSSQEKRILQLPSNQVVQKQASMIVPPPPIAHLDLAMTNCQTKTNSNQATLEFNSTNNSSSESKRSHSASEILMNMKDDISLRQQFIPTQQSDKNYKAIVQQLQSTKPLDKPLESLLTEHVAEKVISTVTTNNTTTIVNQNISDQLVKCITTTANKGIILKSVSNVGVNAPVSQLSVIPPSAVGTTVHQPALNMQFVGNQLKIEDNNRVSSSDPPTSLLDNDNLNNLGLGSLGIGLGMNINIGGLEGMVDTMSHSDHVMKLEMDVIDKIDDLSVLDGNPFDSIPNLSDELDGLDLDLVDGLCDFEGLLSDEKKYPSFFSLIRDVLCSTRDHRMNLLCLEKTIRKWTTSPSASLNGWFMRVSDWNNALVTALNFLAGNYQDVHPEDFVPYIEYKYKTKYYQWIGAGRDGDNNLTPLCSMWMDNLDRLPSVKKIDGEVEDQEEDDEENEDSELTGEEAKKKHKRALTPPPPRCITDWSVRPSTEEEKLQFRKQERSRFENPHKAFTYTMHGYESVVGPVKGVYSSQVGMTNKARGHSLLVDDRPPYVTILALVRDAVARLPNGEGTRSEICEMLKDSAFLAPDASSVTLNSVVSGALDRLHYERDPCVRYDSHKKSWIYLHRDRTQEQFERLHHNRSYTKSTKSRNNTARKSRRGVSKSQSEAPASGDSSTNTPTMGVTCTTTVSSTPTTIVTSVEDIKPLLTSTPIATTSFVKVPVTGGNNLVVGKTSSPCLTEALNTLPKLETVAETSHSPATVSIPTKTIRLTNLSDNLSGSVQSQELLSSTPVSGISPPQFVVQSGSPFCTVSSFQPNSSIQLQNSKPTLQVQNVISSTETSTANSQPITQGQILLGPSTVLRLANALRCQIRLPGAIGNLNSTTMRLPQHRILLTRGSVPGTQTQGVLLGQTSTGQTVILSTNPSNTMSGFQVQHPLTQAKLSDGSPCTIQLPNVDGSEMKSQTFSLRPMNPSTLDNSHTVSIGAGGTILAKTTSTQQGSSVLDSNSKLLQLISGASTLSLLNKPPTFVSSPSSTVLTVPASQVMTSCSPSFQQRQPVGYAVASVRGSRFSIPSTSTNAPMTGTIQLQTFPQNAIGQQSTQNFITTTQQDSDGNFSQSPMSSPIIIRSAQGEFMIPGNISFGRGVQGIKLIPLPMGNKAVLAKLISPAAPRMSTSTATTISTLGSSTPTTQSVCPPQQLP